MNSRQLFLRYLAQTTDDPIALEITDAKGNYLYNGNKKYLDLIGGISVANTGHGQPEIINAIKSQAEKYTHIMVYGELIQSPQYKYAEKIIEELGDSYESVFFTNSGSEAIEAAMKLAKKYTNRSKIFAFKNSYHGSTQGALSLLGDEYWRRNFRPLLPEIYHFDFNNDSILDAIDESVACVIMEAIQAEEGVLAAKKEWIQAITQKCKETGTLLILDEVQTGFGRTGSLFAHTSFGIQADVLVLGKALGGGMPLGAIVTSQEKMSCLSDNPILGHITTFGGHPVSCAAGLASLNFLLDKELISEVAEKEIVLGSIAHPKIQKVQHHGLWAAIFLDDLAMAKDVSHKLLDESVFTDWFLFAQNALRVSPPLTVEVAELEDFVQKLYKVLDLI